VVDRSFLAQKIAGVRDATARIRAVLPATAELFTADRTVREIVILNLFVAIQGCLDLASHWLAHEGWTVPQRYADLFSALAEHEVISLDLSRRLASAAGLRNLVAHQYGALNWNRVYALAGSPALDDLEEFCAALAARAK